MQGITGASRNDAILSGTPEKTPRYEVLAEHARGGLGEILLAHDRALYRDVALKQIQQPFADDAEHRDRFIREAVVTGSLEHPGIVPVYDLGFDSRGRPYYVMRMIRGRSLAEAIADFHAQGGPTHSLELRKLLTRFLTVCHTLHYAHSRGVLHRDIKPSNIMLGPYGETLLVDWGLARTFPPSQSLSEQKPDGMTPLPLHEGQPSSTGTEWGTLIGTPAYMSPEQALGWHDRLTPASDIYSMGATLYHVLTGRPPLQGSSLESLIINVQQQAFPRPRQLFPAIPRDLEAICLKAMARQVSQRYPTAAHMADDIERFLADEPVTARSPTWVERGGRVIRKHRMAVLASLIGMTMVLISLSAIVVILSLAQRRETILRQGIEHQRDLAQQDYLLAREAVEQLLTQTTDTPELLAPGLEPARCRLLQQARQFYLKLLERHAHDATLVDDVAWAYFRLGSIEQEIGTQAEAQRYYEEALRLFEPRLQARPGDLPSWEGSVFTHRNLALVLRSTGNVDGAWQHLNQAQYYLENFPAVSDHVRRFQSEQLAGCWNNRGAWLLQEGRLEEALAALEQAKSASLKWLEQSPSPRVVSLLCGIHVNLGLLHQRAGRKQQAEQELVAGKRLADEFSTQFNDDFLLHARARLVLQLAQLFAEEYPQKAEALFQQGRELLETLVRRRPAVMDFRYDLVRCLNNCVAVYFPQRRWQIAAEVLNEALALCRTLVQDDPHANRYQELYAEVLVNLANAYDGMELFSQALESVQTAEGIYQQLLTSTADKETQLRWLRALLVKGQLLDRFDQAEIAERAYLEVVQFLDGQLQSGDVTADWLIERARADEYLGRFLRKRGRTGEARGYLEHGMAIRGSLLRQHPSPARAEELVILAEELVSCWRDEHLLEPACLCIDRAIVALTSQGELYAQPSVSTNVVHLLLQRALLRGDLGTYIGALADLDQVSTLGAPQSLADDMMAFRARCLAHLGRHREAATIVEETLPRIGFNPYALYDAAAALAVSARQVSATTGDHGQDVTPSQSNNYRKAAWQVLERLREIGYFRNSANRQRWLADPQFAFLRGQSECAEFLRRLHAEQSHQ